MRRYSPVIIAIIITITCPLVAITRKNSAFGLMVIVIPRSAGAATTTCSIIVIAIVVGAGRAPDFHAEATAH